MKGDREKFLENGMDGYVTKPVDFGELARLWRPLGDLNPCYRRERTQREPRHPIISGTYTLTILAILTKFTPSVCPLVCPPGPGQGSACCVAAKETGTRANSDEAADFSLASFLRQ
jgi:CheY-like chemotaxis protein